VVVRHKQHCFFVHTPPSQLVPVLSGFAVQGFPPQEKPPHVKGGVVGAGVVVAQRQHRLLSQTLPMQTKGCNVGRGSHGVLHFHDEQYVGGVVVGAGVVVAQRQHRLLSQTLPMQTVVAKLARGSHGVLHVHDEQVVGVVVGAGVVVRHKQHCFFVHTPPSQVSPVLSGFAVQGGPPQMKPPHVNWQHCLLSQTLPMQTVVATSARGSHGVLHFHDEQYVGGVVVGAGVVVRHSQHCLSEQTFATPLSLQISVAAMFLGVQTPLHTHDAQSVGWVVVVLWKQHCSMVHVPAVQTMSLKDACRETQGSPGQLMEAHVAGGFGVVVITMSQQTLRVQPPTGQTVFGMGAPFAFHPGEHVYRGDAQVRTGTTGGFGVVVVHTQQKNFIASSTWAYLELGKCNQLDSKF
jgi:hypothetical protein